MQRPTPRSPPPKGPRPRQCHKNLQRHRHHENLQWHRYRVRLQRQRQRSASGEPPVALAPQALSAVPVAQSPLAETVPQPPPARPAPWAVQLGVSGDNCSTATWTSSSSSTVWRQARGRTNKGQRQRGGSPSRGYTLIQRGQDRDTLRHGLHSTTERSMATTICAMTSTVMQRLPGTNQVPSLARSLSPEDSTSPVMLTSWATPSFPFLTMPEFKYLNNSIHLITIINMHFLYKKYFRVHYWCGQSLPHIPLIEMEDQPPLKIKKVENTKATLDDDNSPNSV